MGYVIIPPYLIFNSSFGNRRKVRELLLTQSIDQIIEKFIDNIRFKPRKHRTNIYVTRKSGLYKCGRFTLTPLLNLYINEHAKSILDIMQKSIEYIDPPYLTNNQDVPIFPIILPTNPTKIYLYVDGCWLLKSRFFFVTNIKINAPYSSFEYEFIFN